MKFRERLRGLISTNEGRAELGAISVLVGLVTEVGLAFRFRTHQSFLEEWGPLVADALIALGVYVEIHFGRKASNESAERVSEANTRAAEANQRAQEAILELARWKAPRQIGPEQIVQIADNLSKYSGTQFDLAISVPDPEISTLLTLIEWALQKAGWQVASWNGTGQIEMRPNGRSLAVGRGLAVDNVIIGINVERQHDPSGQAARALVGVLETAGIVSKFVVVPNTVSNPTAVHVMIGRKT